MKKVLITVAFFVILSSSILYISNLNSNKNSSPNSNAKTNTTQSSQGKIFTLTELSKYNGQNGTPAYVAVNGIVYDVTNARNWYNGVHVNGVVAGTDLTNVIGNSPHGTSVLSNLPIVGTLK
jgi:predicted heme/steroid binding protein